MKVIAEHQINIYYAPYLVNGDASGMTDAEMAEVDSYLAEVKGDLILDSNDDEVQWGRCDITGLMADCHTYVELAR